MTTSLGDSGRRMAFDVKTGIADRKARRLLRALLASQYLPREDLSRLQQSRAAAIARFAGTESPYYRDLYRDEGLSLDDLSDPDAWSRLPTTDRTQLRDHTHSVRTAEHSARTAEERRTGGSTGQPLVTWTDTRFPYRALPWRMYSWWGIQPYVNLAHLGVWAPSRVQKARYDLRWWPTRHVWTHPGLMTPELIESFVEAMRRTGTALLEGYVGAVAEVADYVSRRGLSLPSLRAVAVTAAPLIPATRGQITHGLGVPVYDHYRCSEVPFLAAECAQQRGQHVFAEHRRIEIVDEHNRPLPDGVEGDVLVTDLSNRVFPIVRYRLGDRGRYLTEPCACEVTLPLIESPKGRLSTLLRLPDGTLMAAGIAGLFAGIPDAVRQFKIHQRADYSVHITVVVGDAGTAREQVEKVVEDFRGRARRQVPVTVEYVERIPHERGKIRFVVSDVPGTA